ncbi:MAG: hypothetical protein AAGA53_01030 [Pseudomonadota bacterium]
MREQSNHVSGETPPTLFAQNQDGPNQIVPLFDAVMSMDRKLDIMQVLEKTAEQSGFDFLFEMPCALFNLPDHRAAVLDAAPDEETSNPIFILVDMEDNIIGVMGYEEIPDRAKHFFCSFTSVLSRLCDIPTVKDLH